MKRESEWSELLYRSNLPSEDFDDLCEYAKGERSRLQFIECWLASLSEDRQKEAWKQIQARCPKEKENISFKFTEQEMAEALAKIVICDPISGVKEGTYDLEIKYKTKQTGPRSIKIDSIILTIGSVRGTRCTKGDQCEEK